MFRLLNGHLQAYSLQVKSQDAVHNLGPHAGIPMCDLMRSNILKLSSQIKGNSTNIQISFTFLIPVRGGHRDTCPGHQKAPTYANV